MTQDLLEYGSTKVDKAARKSVLLDENIVETLRGTACRRYVVDSRLHSTLFELCHNYV